MVDRLFALQAEGIVGVASEPMPVNLFFFKIVLFTFCIKQEGSFKLQGFGQLDHDPEESKPTLPKAQTGESTGHGTTPEPKRGSNDLRRWGGKDSC
jgi:hypothetical protein